ncbi:MAG: hypothetical protein MN733_42790, partial [Nitrososphaera sp.]|nr:hypothetical protein [Nitrososphaera sp.]
MNPPSFERINYSLRAAKNVQRKMLCDAIARMTSIESLTKYRYIGLGALAFVDFGLFHQRLGMTDLISIEDKEEHKDRIKFNRPYSCIKILWGHSNKILPTLDWAKRTIAWLDYDKKLNAKMLHDIATVSANVRSGSMLVVTVDAEPLEDSEDTPVNIARMNDLAANVGRDNIPLGLQPRDLAGWGLAKISRGIIFNKIEQAINDRNAAAIVAEQLTYFQLFHFHYADGSKMVTVGGIFLNNEDKKRLPPRNFFDLEFCRAGNDAYRIEAPLLTIRELKLLDGRLPQGLRASSYRWI